METFISSTFILLLAIIASTIAQPGYRYSLPDSTLQAQQQIRQNLPSRSQTILQSSPSSSSSSSSAVHHSSLSQPIAHLPPQQLPLPLPAPLPIQVSQQQQQQQNNIYSAVQSLPLTQFNAQSESSSAAGKSIQNTRLQSSSQQESFFQSPSPVNVAPVQSQLAVQQQPAFQPQPQQEVFQPQPPVVQQAVFQPQPQPQQAVFQPQQSFQSNRQGPQTAIITKDIYIHSAPEEFDDSGLNSGFDNAPIRKNYRIVFIKAPSQNLKAAAAALKRAQAASEEKTVIYVLSKKPDLSEVHQQLSFAAQNEQKANKPEVYFIKYKTQEEAVRAQQQIQAQYDALGGSTHISDEGVAPVTTFGAANLSGPISPVNSISQSASSSLLSQINSNGGGGSSQHVPSQKYGVFKK